MVTQNTFTLCYFGSVLPFRCSNSYKTGKREENCVIQQQLSICKTRPKDLNATSGKQYPLVNHKSKISIKKIDAG